MVSILIDIEQAAREGSKPMISQHQLQSCRLSLIGTALPTGSLLLFHSLPEAAEMQHTGLPHGLALYQLMTPIIERAGVPVQAGNYEPYLVLRKSSP